MRDEYLDIVDENNKETGESMSRPLVHANNVWHRIVNIYFFRKSGENIELLVHLRSSINDVDPNKWDARFGGHIRVGERPEEAIVREIKEEIGLNMNVREFIEGGYQKRKNPKNEFAKIYYFEFWDSAEELKFNDKEVQGVKWMFINDVEDSMIKESEIWSGGPAAFKKETDFLVNLLSSGV